MSDLTDHDLKNYLQKLKKDLSEFPEGSKSMEVQLESTAKHLPAYLKIVKSHIEQLRNVLQLENHNNRTLESAGLADPVKQLIELFGKLQEGDVEMLEDLATAARNWIDEEESENVRSMETAASTSDA